MAKLNLNALRQAQLQRDPFDYLVVPDFIGPEQLRAVNADYPTIETAANHDLDSLSGVPCPFRAIVCSLMRVALEKFMNLSANRKSAP